MIMRLSKSFYMNFFVINAPRKFQTLSPTHIPHYWNIMTFILTSLLSGFRLRHYKRTLCQVGRISLKLLIPFPQVQTQVSGLLPTPGNGSSLSLTPRPTFARQPHAKPGRGFAQALNPMIDPGLQAILFSKASKSSFSIENELILIAKSSTIW